MEMGKGDPFELKLINYSWAKKKLARAPATTGNLVVKSSNFINQSSGPDGHTVNQFEFYDSQVGDLL